MSGETSLKFIIPESSCQKDFEVWALFADGAKESILRCDWVDKYYCDSAPGYTHTLENGTAVITVPRDLEKKPDDFICDTFFRPKTDASWCLCKRAAIIIPGQPDSDSPGHVALIAGVSVTLVLLFLILVGFLIYKYCYRQYSSGSKQDPNVKPDEYEHLRPQNGEPRMDVPQISATDSQESSTPAVTAPPTETVPPKKETIIQLSHPDPA